MAQDLYWIYAFNLIVNSFLAFLTMALLTQLLLFISRVKLRRFKALMLSLPILKLGFDPFLYDFRNWALMAQHNPLHAEADTRILSVSFAYASSIADLFPLNTAIRFSLDNGLSFSPADMAALLLPPLVLKSVILSVTAVSVVILSIYFYRLSVALKIISHIKRYADPSSRTVVNQKLLVQLKSVRLIASSDVNMPCAFGVFSKWICFPSKLLQKLTQEEFEAIVAHEVNHLRWYDGAVRAFCHFISNLFWWIPIQWWVSRLECEQEKACDAYIDKFKIDGIDLASALLKTITAERCAAESLLFSAPFAKKNLTAERLELLMDSSFGQKGRFRWLQAIILSLILLSLFCGRFWIF